MHLTPTMRRAHASFTENLARNLSCGLALAFAVLILLGLYALYWEKSQPKRTLESKVVSIEPYRNSFSDIHWSSRGYRVRVIGENRIIDFAMSNWDPSVRVGDEVDLLVRSSFPYFGLLNELDGLSIKKHP